MKCLWWWCLRVLGCLLQIQYSTALKRHFRNWLGMYCLCVLIWICCPIQRHSLHFYTSTLLYVTSWQPVWIKRLPFWISSATILASPLPLPLTSPYGWVLGGDGLHQGLRTPRFVHTPLKKVTSPVQWWKLMFQKLSVSSSPLLNKCPATFKLPMTQQTHKIFSAVSCKILSKIWQEWKKYWLSNTKEKSNVSTSQK